MAARRKKKTASALSATDTRLEAALDAVNAKLDELEPIYRRKFPELKPGSLAPSSVRPSLEAASRARVLHHSAFMTYISGQDTEDVDVQRRILDGARSALREAESAVRLALAISQESTLTAEDILARSRGR
jgi:hypothetical protein